MTTRIGKLRYYPNSILGRGNGTTVFKGIFNESIFGVAKNELVAVKRVLKIDVSWREVNIMKKVTDNPYILRLIHTEKKGDFL